MNSARGALVLTLVLAAGPALAAKKPAPPPPIDAGPVVSAERSFAAEAQTSGTRVAFNRYAAPDAIVLRPGPVSVQQALFLQRIGSEGRLSWSPQWAGMSISGDFGFTTGPYSVDGKPEGAYLTVWAKQPQGHWQWIFDGGVPFDASRPPIPPPQKKKKKSKDKDAAPPTGLAYLAAPTMATAPGATAASAWAEVQQAEDELRRRVTVDPQGAFRAVLAEDSRMQGFLQGAATYPEAVEAELAARPTMAFNLLGGRVSKAGDLAFTYGEARWRQGHGNYARIWQKRANGWTLVLDQVAPVKPAGAAPASAAAPQAPAAPSPAVSPAAR